MVYAPAYPTPPAAPRQVLWGVRTKRGLLLTAVSLVLFWIPGLGPVAGLFLSVGSTMMFWDRHAFPPAHRSAMNVAFALFWVAAALYTILFLVFVGTAYYAWLGIGRMNELLPAVVLFVWDSTAPTLLVVVALLLQIARLLPARKRRLLWVAGILATGLIVLATVIAYLDVSAGIGTEFVRMSSVLGVLNRISIARMVEGPGFTMLAYLYYVARAGVVPKSAAEGAPAPVLDVPPAT